MYTFYFILYSGWAGSSPKNVQKYTQFYASEFGIGAHGYILPMEIYFSYDLKKISQISKELVQQLAKQHSGKRILFHFFSNNGLGMYKPLTTILKYQPYGYALLYVWGQSFTSLKADLHQVIHGL